MKRDIIVISNEILVTQVNHWFLFPIVVTLTGLTAFLTGENRPNLFLWVIFSLLPLLFFLIRQKTQRFVPFLVLHFAITAAAGFFFPVRNLFERILAIACAIFYLLNSLYQRFSSNTNDAYEAKYSPIVMIAVSGAALLFQHYHNSGYPEGYYIFPVILILVLYFISYYLEKYLEFLRLNEASTGYLPEREMFHSGFGLAFFYTTFAGLLLLLTANVQWLAAILTVVKNIVARILCFLFSLLPKGDEETPIFFSETQAVGQPDMELPAGGEGFWLWDVLSWLAAAAFLAGAAFVLYKSICRLIRFLKARFLQQKLLQETDGMCEIFDIREKCDMEKQFDKKGFLDLWKYLSPSERVRRLYKKCVLSQNRFQSNLQSSGNGLGNLLGENIVSAKPNQNPIRLTAREYAAAIKAPLIGEIYEKARYSKEGADSEDARRMKEAWKGSLWKDLR